MEELIIPENCQTNQKGGLMEVLISNRQKKVKLNKKRLQIIAEEIMKFEELPDNTELSLVLCDDDFIQKLNHEYLGKNRPTDVLSFPLEEDDFDSEIRLLGDVVISIETASHQAQKMRHSVGLEVVFLLIHGFLHLVGYDHAQGKAEMLRMKTREELICRLLSDKKLLKGIEESPQSTLIGRTVKAKETKN